MLTVEAHISGQSRLRGGSFCLCRIFLFPNPFGQLGSSGHRAVVSVCSLGTLRKYPSLCVKLQFELTKRCFFFSLRCCCCLLGNKPFSFSWARSAFESGLLDLNLIAVTRAVCCCLVVNVTQHMCTVWQTLPAFVVKSRVANVHQHFLLSADSDVLDANIMQVTRCCHH